MRVSPARRGAGARGAGACIACTEFETRERERVARSDTTEDPKRTSQIGFLSL